MTGQRVSHQLSNSQQWMCEDIFYIIGTKKLRIRGFNQLATKLRRKFVLLIAHHLDTRLSVLIRDMMCDAAARAPSPAAPTPAPAPTPPPPAPPAPPPTPMGK